MTIDAIRAAVNAEPFRPFRLRLAGGPTIAVLHPDYIALGPRGRTVIIYQPDESWREVDVFHVTEIKPERRKAQPRH
ncbi:MAG: hypothetical protein C5B50_22010 [Verrucomicrobia bacterium]|nr:MAG: hypothetical protein C5B50_22010 [Verrucomicrobiota bacterium]